MYHSYFGFSENPFNLTPDPRYLYLSGYHKAALDHLLYGIGERKGFIAVTGGIGTGKTTLCRELLRHLTENTNTALILNSFITDLELLQQINQEFGINSETRRSESKKELIDALNLFLLEIYSLGGNAVVLIDEAQNLPHPVLEQLRMLSNLENERDKLLQIVLLGQPELAELLAMPSLRQLDDRITVRYHLKPLGRRDVEGYVMHRLSVAGGSGKVRFTKSALSEVHVFSGGNPRRINAVCDRALLMAYAGETHTIKKAMVLDAVKDLRGGMAAERPGGVKSVLLKQALLLLFLLLTMSWAVWQGRGGIAGFLSAGLDGSAPVVVDKEIADAVESRALQANAGLRPPAAEVEAPTLESETLEDDSYGPVGEKPASPDLYLDGPQSASALLRFHESVRGEHEDVALRLVRFQVPPEFQLLFRRPFRLSARRPNMESDKQMYLLILSQDETGADVLDAAGEQRRVDREFMLRHWSSAVSWFVSGQKEIPMLSGGSSSPKVSEVQKILRGLGYQNEITGRYDPGTVEAVRSFQRDTGLMPDGLAGPRTLALLDMMNPIEDGFLP